MRSLLLFIISIIIIMLTLFLDLPGEKNVKPSTTRKYTIVIHGGAGTIDPNMPDSIKKAYINSLSEALQIGKDVLAKGGTALDAVEKVIRFFESDPKFNAGIGSVYTSAGTHEMDASIMDGKDLSCGAVAGVEHIEHPISLARLVMEKTPHILLAYQGAEEFAKSLGIPFVKSSLFDTPERYKQWKDYVNKLKNEKSDSQQNNHGTVGCVALDEDGNLAAGTSTGGMTNKMPGRIGDSPLIGDGTYANNKTCAVSCTGWGEKFIKNAIAFRVSALMEFKGMTLRQAADQIINNTLQKNDGGFIAVDKNGNYEMPFNSEGMFRGIANSSGIFEVKIWK